MGKNEFHCKDFAGSHGLFPRDNMFGCELTKLVDVEGTSVPWKRLRREASMYLHYYKYLISVFSFMFPNLLSSQLFWKIIFLGYQRFLGFCLIFVSCIACMASSAIGSWMTNSSNRLIFSC